MNYNDFKAIWSYKNHTTEKKWAQTTTLLNFLCTSVTTFTLNRKTILSDCFNIPGHEYVAVSLKSAVLPGFSQTCHRS